MALAQQNADPEIEFQSPCLNLTSGEPMSFIRRLAALDLLHCPTQMFYVTLAYPHPHHHHHYRPTTPRRPLPRRHNWSPRAKWHSALTDIRAANNFSYCYCYCYCESLEHAKQWWIEQPRSESTRRYSSITEGGEGWPWPRRHYAWFFWTYSSRIVASLHGSNREKSRWFSDASCKVENHITLLKIQWKKSKRAATRGWLGYTDINELIMCHVKLIRHCSRNLRCPANYTSLVTIQFKSFSFSFLSLLTV